MTVMKTIALIDTLWGGHHQTYLKLFSRTLLELGHKVMVFCPHPEEISEWVAFNRPSLAARLHTFVLREPDPSQFPIPRLRLTFNALARWRSAAAAIQDASRQLGTSPDLVFFAYIDLQLWPYLAHRAIEKIFPYNWSGLYFQPSHLRVRLQLLPIRRGIFNPDGVLKSSRSRSIAVLDEGIAKKLQTRIDDKPVIIFPDIADESPPDPDYNIAQQIIEKAGGRKIVGLLGSIGKRKGILTLLDMAQKSAKENWLFVFAGQLDESAFLPEDIEKIRSIIKQKYHNCFFYFDYIPDGPKFNALVNVCDVLFTAYNNFPHSSNILTKAAIFKKAVIVSQGYCMEERVDKFGLGLSIKEGDVQGGIEALQRLCNHSLTEATKIKPNFEDYCHQHSQQQLHLAFESILAY
jgi:glycosyltransferase involved in cell wall biosynthesis